MPSWLLHVQRLLLREPLGDLDGTLRFGTLDAKFAGSGIDAGLSTMPTPIRTLTFNRRNLRRLKRPLLSKPNPLGDMLGAFGDGQLGAVKVFGDLAPAGASAGRLIAYLARDVLAAGSERNARVRAP